MQEFLELVAPDQALKKFISNITPLERVDTISTIEGLHRITASEIVAPHRLPSFDRSAVDGYAVVAVDTFGTSSTLPGYLEVEGEVVMGEKPAFRIGNGKCALIHTGGMLPEGANAVVMLEDTQQISGKDLEVYRPVAMGENVIKVGEDILEGQVVIDGGKRLRAADIGGILALGITTIDVTPIPKIGIISTGDEVIKPDAQLKPGQVHDINSYTLSALVQSCGAEPIRYGILPDDFERLLETALVAHNQCDLTIVTAGSSASARDLTSRVFDHVGKPGVIVHGVNIRPGKPTILAICDQKPMIGLPGNPVSALVVAKIFATPAINRLSGLSFDPVASVVEARLTINIPSRAGREDWVPVKLHKKAGTSYQGYEAEPIFGKSNLIFTLSRADGLVKISADLTGLNAGEIVEINLL